MLKINSFIIILVVVLVCLNVSASDNTELTVEEQRIEKAVQIMPDVANRFQTNSAVFEEKLANASDFSTLSKAVKKYGHLLWESARSAYASANDYDDRPLYWARLQFSKKLRQADLFQSLPSSEQEQLLWDLELSSRGADDIHFDRTSNRKILITGFDPFFLDRHIDQSNPSGVAAMALDNTLINYNGVTVEIESLIVPVRFEDFDKGMIEELLTPYLKNKMVDMIITISMGRDNFDLEQFPGLRRSAKAPDNLNVFTGANTDSPLPPLLNSKPLDGPEFLQFSLPVNVMKNAPGEFIINDNHQVTTLEKTFSPNSLNELSQQISVSGSGGGYLSNEISYRSLLLRDKYHKQLPVGHIHTPRFKGYKPEKTNKMIKQIKAMISLAAAPPIAIAIHGGAGTIKKSNMSAKKEKAYRMKLKQAVEAGYAVLAKGGDSLEAVTTAINILENSSLFNAGKGAVYTYNEEHELDASIMEGNSRQAGAVAGVKHIENPINLARLVMEKSVHVLLSGQGAEEFAVSEGVPLVDNKLFDTKKRLRALKRAKSKMQTTQVQKTGNLEVVEDLPVEFKVGTVGAVALDKNGNLAAGTSTGGMTNKRYGRIGDSPIIGAGTFADNSSCAVSATGHGEFFIRYNVAADICARVNYQNKTIQQAGDEVIHDVLLPAGGTGGVIILDAKGNMSLPFNTKGMYRATRSSSTPTYVGIFKSE